MLSLGTDCKRVDSGTCPSRRPIHLLMCQSMSVQSGLCHLLLLVLAQLYLLLLSQLCVGLPSLNTTPETTSAKSGATSKSANRPKEPVVVKAPPKAAPLLALGALPKPAVVGGNGSRFVLDAAPQKGYTRMGWLDPVANFGKLISAEISHYAFPFENMMAYSRSRPLWHQLFCGSNQALKEWLLATEEHAFYLFSVKALASLVMMTPSVMKPADREVVLVMERIHSADLADELSHLKSFRYHNDTSVYVASVIAHVRSIIDLRVPFPEGFTFHRAPAWKQIPQKGACTNLVQDANQVVGFTCACRFYPSLHWLLDWFLSCVSATLYLAFLTWLAMLPCPICFVCACT